MPRCDFGTVAKQKATSEEVNAGFCADGAAPSVSLAGYRARQAD
jgi:hypothetical protein